MFCSVFFETQTEKREAMETEKSRFDIIAAICLSAGISVAHDEPNMKKEQRLRTSNDNSKLWNYPTDFAHKLGPELMENMRIQSNEELG